MKEITYLYDTKGNLFEGISYERLLQVLKETFPKMIQRILLGIYRGEDLYTMLIDLDTIVKIEISRYSVDEKPIVQICRIKEFKLGISRLEQIKLAVALDLAKKDILKL